MCIRKNESAIALIKYLKMAEKEQAIKKLIACSFYREK